MPDWSRLAPATETTWGRLPAETLAAVAAADADRLTLERSRLPEQTAQLLTEPTYSVRKRLRFWESLIGRLEGGGRYLVDEYVNDLESRDQLDALPAAVLDGPLGHLLRALDDRFIAATVEDGGAALRERMPRLTAAGALWTRIPRTIPWEP